MHRCRSRDRCAAADGPAITTTAATICHSCVVKLQRQLEQLPAIRAALRVFLGVSPVTSHGSKVNASPTPSAPANVRVIDLQDEIDEVITRAGGPNAIIADLIQRPAEPHVVWHRGQPREKYLDGVDRAMAIATVWRKADQIIGLSRQWLRRHAPCPRCHLRTLGMFAGEDTVHCSNADCGATMPRTDYDDLCINISKGNQ